jgi:dipeptidyl aminopeptidase/acylaminoacyl peptidase
MAFKYKYSLNVFTFALLFLSCGLFAYFILSKVRFAEGLKGHLLICHGMVDVNVHYQDAVKLSQRLIELGKDNWELASYPMEDHGFVEPSSWTDEYKRIFKLFETVLKKP